MKKIKRILSNIKGKCTRSAKSAFDINTKIKKSRWYYSVFPHLRSYEALKRNTDVICVGSTPAKYSVDFENIPDLVGANLAVLPETIYYDFQVIKNYHSYLKKNGTVIFVLCPFTLLKDKYKKEDGNNNYMNIRYYPILHRALIDNFSNDLFDKWVKHPYKQGIRAWISALRPEWSYRATSQEQSAALSDEVLFKNAEERVNKWKNEFKFINLDWADCSEQIVKNVTSNIDIFRTMLQFLKERDYKSVVVIPPFSNAITSMIPPAFIQESLLKPLNELDVKVISYWANEKWVKKELFKDSFRLNPMGRCNLTLDLVERLKKEGLL